MLRNYAKGVAAAVTGAVDVALVALVDGAAQADTWVTAALLAVANFVGTVAVVKLRNGADTVADAAESVAEEWKY